MPSCPLCQSASTKEVAGFDAWFSLVKDAEDERKNIFSVLKEDTTLHFRTFLECAACGFLWIDPMPDTATLSRFYQAYYASRKYASKGKKKIARAQKRIRGLKLQAKGGDFLDIGCNLGYAAEAARREGFQATGIEIDGDAVTTASISFPQNEYKQSTIEAFAKTGRRFDLAYCSEVMEHVPDAHAFMAAMAKLVKPGGHVFITTPDAGHFRRPKELIRWNEVKPPEHVCWYTKQNLRMLFEKHGFTVKKFWFTLKPGIKMLAERSAT